MKKGMLILTIVSCALTLTITTWGAEKSMPGTVSPTLRVAPKTTVVKRLPDLVVTSFTLQSSSAVAYVIGKDAYGNDEKGINVEINIKNQGNAATSTTFSVDVAKEPQCTDPDCNCHEASVQAQLICGVKCQERKMASKFFRFKNPISINTPIMAGETRTIWAVLVFPACFRYSGGVTTHSVYVIVDDKNQVSESKEDNNKSAPLMVTYK